MPTEARGLLERAEARIGPRRSLAPGRTRATSLVELADLFAPLPADAAMAAASALVAVADALRVHFPENVFADLDVVAGQLADDARRSPRRASETAERLVALHQLYGRSTTIRFRYVHDFLYGFDWARWVAAEPDPRKHELPFGRGFLDRSLERGRELLGLIAEDDPKYRRLEPGEVRSPFPFRRDPEAETRILLALAEGDAIPVCAWDPTARGTWDRPFVRLREEKARSLGLL
jgi:hypothetical protein